MLHPGRCMLTVLEVFGSFVNLRARQKRNAALCIEIAEEQCQEDRSICICPLCIATMTIQRTMAELFRDLCDRNPSFCPNPDTAIEGKIWGIKRNMMSC